MKNNNPVFPSISSLLPPVSTFLIGGCSYQIYVSKRSSLDESKEYLSTFLADIFQVSNETASIRHTNWKVNLYVSNMLLFIPVLNHYIFVQALFFL